MESGEIKSRGPFSAENDDFFSALKTPEAHGHKNEREWNRIIFQTKLKVRMKWYVCRDVSQVQWKNLK